MGRHTDPAVVGSRRAAVVTLTVSAVLVVGGFAILHEAGGFRHGHASTPSTPAVPAVTPTSRVDDATEPGRTPSTSPGTSPSASGTTSSTLPTSPQPSLTTRAPAPLVTAPEGTRTVAAPPSGTAGTASATSPTATPAKPAKPAPPPRAGVAQQVVALVNVERSRAGCGPVSVNAPLRRAAQDHSDDMAARDYFSHTSPDGVTFAERIRAAGYAGGAIAENIAAGQTSAKDVMRGWMASRGHRANILNCAYRDIGVGYATGGSYGTYWTQTFGG
jgi:uncharacterized protein YkwD